MGARSSIGAAGRAALQTFGCRLNQSETEGLRADLIARGYEVVPFRERADLYVINTCSVTGSAEADARRAIRRARERGGPAARVVVTGCFAQRDPEVVGALPGVDIVIGNDRKHELPELVGELGTLARVSVGDIGSVTHFAEYALPSASERTRAYLRVQDGCEDVCTFCVVPMTRGVFRSLELARAVDRFAELVAEGYREIVLTGANLSSYGAERPSGPGVAELVAALLEVEGDYRLRLSSFEPSDLTTELVELFCSSPRLCRHLHLPVQSLADPVLRSMRRSYDAETAIRAMQQLAEQVSGISIGTDLMVGFPGETEDDFLLTLQRVSELPLSYFHVFPYSSRPATEAATRPDGVPKDEKRRRSRLLRDVGAERAQRFALSQVGTPARVLVERFDTEFQYWRGYTDNYLRVTLPAGGSDTNHFVDLTLARDHLDQLRRPHD
jgi:threonylcarbamoyladenosine tRNA methylthiotransferase MtaB